MSLTAETINFIVQYRRVEDEMAKMADKLAEEMSLGKKTNLQDCIFELGLMMEFILNSEHDRKHEYLQYLIKKLNLYYMPVDINCFRSSDYVDKNIDDILDEIGGGSGSDSNNNSESYVLVGSDTNRRYVLEHGLNSSFVDASVTDNNGDIVAVSKNVLSANIVVVEFYAPIGSGLEYTATLTISQDDTIQRIIAS